MSVSALRRLAIMLGILTVTGCALWNPLDNDHYEGRADATLIIDEHEYRTSWTVPIDRISSFNPYSNTGRQDCWRFGWGRGSVALADGTLLWIDAFKAVAKTDEARLLGITGAQPIPRPQRSPDILTPTHPLMVAAPVYVSATRDHPTGLKPYAGPCGKSGACNAAVKITVPDNYVGPYDRHPANVVEWSPGICD